MRMVKLLIIYVMFSLLAHMYSAFIMHVCYYYS